MPDDCQCFFFIDYFADCVIIVLLTKEVIDLKILVIDGQGGNIGKQLVKMILSRFPDIDLVAIGTNSLATSSMLKAGAQRVATGENAVCVCAAKAEIIVGPLGIAMADALLGEVTLQMAAAVCRSSATRILIPIGKCDTFVAGTGDTASSVLLEDAVNRIARIMNGSAESGNL